jgi:hypothetical protein
LPDARPKAFFEFLLVLVLVLEKTGIRGREFENEDEDDNYNDGVLPVSGVTMTDNAPDSTGFSIANRKSQIVISLTPS